ncbi:hypothetical protein [Carboxylicivirga taeanensis]|uniref:hypothetical protein n=1 Tax=Carboxylicivirga taeanensis TaxID=1416875 RepID=UPI003F6E3BC6
MIKKALSFSLVTLFTMFSQAQSPQINRDILLAASMLYNTYYQVETKLNGRDPSMEEGYREVEFFFHYIGTDSRVMEFYCEDRGRDRSEYRVIKTRIAYEEAASVLDRFLKYWDENQYFKKLSDDVFLYKGPTNLEYENRRRPGESIYLKAQKEHANLVVELFLQ